MCVVYVCVYVCVSVLSMNTHSFIVVPLPVCECVLSMSNADTLALLVCVCANICSNMSTSADANMHTRLMNRFPISANTYHTEDGTHTYTPPRKESDTAEEFYVDSRVENLAVCLPLGLLSTSEPTELAVPKIGDAVELENSKQRALLRNAQLVISKPIGRVAVLVGVGAGVPVGINLNGLISTTVGGAVQGAPVCVSIDFTQFPVDALIWPEFHNGVSHAMAMGVLSREKILSEKLKIDQILNSKRIPPELGPSYTHRHAGWLFGAALLGGLGSLRPDDCYRYLKQQNECISVAIILGTALHAPSSARLCFMHIPSLLKLESLDIPLVVSAAAVAGLGFVYLESGNPQIASLLIDQIGWSPPTDRPALEKEAYALSAGLAFGLVNLGNSPLPGKLIEYMCAANNLGKPAPPDPAKCSLERGNFFATLPAACVALGLGYLWTNNEAVASTIPFPRTLDELAEEPRWDSLMYKCLARGLICPPNLSNVSNVWNWLKSQIPPFLRIPEKLEIRETRVSGSDTPSSVDWMAVYQGALYGLTGACVSLAVRFAGGGNLHVKNGLLKLFSKLDKLLIPKNHCAAQCASRPSPRMALDRGTIETCRSCVVLCLATVMAGSGDLEIHALIDSIVCDEFTVFGVNMALNLARGFLALGSGSGTSFKTSKFAAACILMSILPRFPNSVGDNRFSLQAFRHLYVLGTENRAIKVIDRQTGVPVGDVDLEVFNNNTVHTTKLSKLGRLDEHCFKIKIVSDRHYPVEFDPRITQTVYMELIPGKFSTQRDPTGYLDASRVYISEFSIPRMADVERLAGCKIAGKRIDVRQTNTRLSQMASLTLTRMCTHESLAELREETHQGRQLSQKYAQLLKVDETEWANRVRLLKKCVKNNQSERFYDLLESKHFEAHPT